MNKLNKLNKLGVIAGLTIAAVVSAADFEAGMSAYERQDYTLAYQEFSELAEQGNPEAQYLLARLYQNGNGIPQDYIQAHKWFNIAAAAGHSPAARARDELAERMSAQQIQRAQRLASRWQPSDITDITQDSAADDGDSDEPISRRLIRRIQRDLNRRGYEAGPEDGLMGSTTRSAIRAYQRDNGLAIDGEASRELLAHLRDDGDTLTETPPQIAEPSGDRRLVRDVQTALNRLGYEAGPEDGLMGFSTRNAIRAYQSDHDLREDGQPTFELLSHIREQGTERVPPAIAQPSDEPRLLFEDTFRDGDYTRDPRWTVAAGNFRVERRVGLRSVVERDRPLFERPSTGDVGKDIGLTILQTIIEQATDIGTAVDDGPNYAEIYTPARIDNAFAIEVEFNSRQPRGSLEFGPYQRRDRSNGYRIVYLPGEETPLLLVRLARNNEVIDAYRGPIDLEDGRHHTLRWEREPDGAMVVTLNGRTVLRARDRSFQDDFSGFTVVNRGGDYALRSVSVSGIDG